MSVDRIRRWAPAWLAMLFLASGTLHLVRPRFFRPLLPSRLPARDAIVVVSGLAELACAGGLLTHARWAGPASALLLAGVFPGNVIFAARTTVDPNASRTLRLAALARLPLQAPLIWAALQSRPSRSAPRP